MPQIVRTSLFIVFSAFVCIGASGRLNIGDEFPAASGPALSGEQLQLPAAGSGSTRVLIFSFSHASGADSRLWSQRLTSDFGPNSRVIAYRIIVLESVPKLFRGMAVSGIKSGLPRNLWDTTMLLYKDSASWKERLAVTSDAYCYLLAIDGDGRVRWTSPGPFSDARYDQLKEALAQIPGKP